MNDDFNEFVKETIKKYEKQYNNERNKFLFTDIINIYIGMYKDYNDYLVTINWINECITKQNEGTRFSPITIVIEYHPLHAVLSEEDFNCIIEIRNEHNER